MKVCCLLMALAGETAVAGVRASDVNSYFANAPELDLKSTAPLAVSSCVTPTLFGPSSGAPGHSYYVFSLGQLTEIRMDNGATARHAIDFDRPTKAGRGAGVNDAWLGPDLKIYFGMNGEPEVIGRFDPAAARIEKLGEISGHATLRRQWGPDNKCYVVTYPAMLGEIDAVEGKVRDLGRLAPDAQYVYGEMWVGTNGFFYCTAGIRPPRKVSVNLANGRKKILDEFPEVGRAAVPSTEFPDCAKLYDVSVHGDGDKAALVYGRKDAKERGTATFACDTRSNALDAIVAGPDGKVYFTGSYKSFVFDPATGKAEPQGFMLSIYDYEPVGAKLFFAGYPNARLAVLDPARPLSFGPRTETAYNTTPDRNPREVLCVFNMKDSAGEPLKMKRIWSIARGGDGMLYLGCSATRQARGGALVAFDPDGEKPVWSLREPFRYLGIASLCPIDSGKQLGIVTWVSPDYTATGKEPGAGRLFIYDVATSNIVHEAVPLPRCKVLRAIRQAPGTRMLVGIGLRGVNPTEEADDAFHGNGELFFFDLDAMKTVKRQPFDFDLSRREGRPLAPAPDGSLWLSGGGGILRVDAVRLAVEPVARCGVSGNMVFVGNTLYMVGDATLRYGDVSAFTKATTDR